MDAYVVFQEGDAENAGHMYAENDHHYPADTGYPDAQVVEQSAKGGCRNAKKHKDNAKAEYKSQAVRKGYEAISWPVFTPGRPGNRYTPEPVRRHRGKEKRPDRLRMLIQLKCWNP